MTSYTPCTSCCASQNVYLFPMTFGVGGGGYTGGNTFLGLVSNFNTAFQSGYWQVCVHDPLVAGGCAPCSHRSAAGVLWQSNLTNLNSALDLVAVTELIDVGSNAAGAPPSRLPPAQAARTEHPSCTMHQLMASAVMALVLMVPPA